MTEMLQRAYELALQLPAERQDAIAAQMIEEIESASDYPEEETLETFLGDALNRPPPGEDEMAELRALAEHDPGVAAALWLSERGGLDVEAILEMRNAERDSG